MDKKFKETHFKTILKYVDKLCPKQRKPKYSPEYYLNNIVDMLTDFVSWKSITKSINCVSKRKNHFQTIANKHRLWSAAGVYCAAYKEIVQRNNANIDGDNKTLQILMDSTLINNKCGSENVGFGSETRKKKFTKLSVATDTEGKTLAIIANNTLVKEIVFKQKNGGNGKLQRQMFKEEQENIKKKIRELTTNITLMGDEENDNDKIKRSAKLCREINLLTKKLANLKVKKMVVDQPTIENANDETIIKKIDEYVNAENTNKNTNDNTKKILIKTLEHDVKGVLPLVEELKKMTKNEIEIIADKGYIMSEANIKTLASKKVTLITPKRSNQDIKNTKTEKAKLKGRYKVENTFAKIKAYNRIYVRRDRKMVNFMGFVWLGLAYVS